MKPWEDAADLLLPDVRDCPWAMARSRLILAAREFFARSGVWTAKLDPIPSQAGVAEYEEIVPTANMEIVRVRECWYGTAEVQPLLPNQFFDREIEHTETGVPEYMTVDADVLLLSCAPAESGIDIRVEAIFKPSMVNQGLPDDLWDQHVETIVEGAKALLYRSQAKPYTDLQLAGIARQEFINATGTARERASKGSARAIRRVRGHFF